MYQLKHHAQQSTWDCGLSCICMLLVPDLADDLQNNMSVVCAEEYQNQRYVPLLEPMLVAVYTFVVFL